MIQKYEYAAKHYGPHTNDDDAIKLMTDEGWEPIASNAHHDQDDNLWTYVLYRRGVVSKETRPHPIDNG